MLVAVIVGMGNTVMGVLKGMFVGMRMGVIAAVAMFMFHMHRILLLFIFLSLYRRLFALSIKREGYTPSLTDYSTGLLS
jgi:hypothetical protein